MDECGPSPATEKQKRSGKLNFEVIPARAGTRLRRPGLLKSHQDDGGDGMEKRADGKVVESGVEARQGFLGRPVLAVLAVSTVLAALVLAVLWGVTL
jgi:hypothetical protein